MKIRALGVSGSELPGQNLPAFLIDGTVLLDAGTIGQSLDSAAQAKISHIVLTHAHLDHVKGIPFLLDNMTAAATGGAITLLSGSDVLLDIRRNLLNDRIWPDFTRIRNGRNRSLQFRSLSPARQSVINGYRISCEKMNHTVPSYGYIIGQPGRKSLAYTGDTGPTIQFWEKVSRLRADCLIVETSYPDRLSSLALKTGHLTPSLLQKELLKITHRPSKIYITHSKPGYLKEIKREIKALQLSDLEFLGDNQVFTV